MIRKFMNWLFGKKTTQTTIEVKPQTSQVVETVKSIEAKVEKLVEKEQNATKAFKEAVNEVVSTQPAPAPKVEATKPKPSQPKQQPKNSQPKMNAEPKKDQPKKQEVKQSNPTNGKPNQQKSKRGRKPKNNQATDKKN